MKYLVKIALDYSFTWLLWHRVKMMTIVVLPDSL